MYNVIPFWYDIALVEVWGFINTMVGIPINLPYPFQKVSDDTLCLVSGWGDTQDYNTTLLQELRAVNVPIWNQARCKAALPYDNISGHMVCAGYQEEEKRTCGVN